MITAAESRRIKIEMDLSLEEAIDLCTVVACVARSPVCYELCEAFEQLDIPFDATLLDRDEEDVGGLFFKER